MFEEKNKKKEDPDKLAELEIVRLRNSVLKWVEASKNKPETERNKSLKKTTKKAKSTEPTKSKKTKNKWLKRTTLILISVLIIILVVFGASLYYFKPINKITLTVTKIIPYPAAIVDYKPVSYFQWADNVNTLLNFYQKQNQVNPEIKFPNLIDTEKHAFNLIIDQLLLDELAKKYQVSITKEEITQQTNRVAKEIGNQTALEKQIKNLYDWDLTKFQQEIIKPIILKSKINLALNYNDVLNATALQEINYIAAKLKTAPALFEDLAKAYSQDLATANQGGDLGYISRDQTVPEFEKEAFTLEPGQISDIIITEFGFHLIKVEEKLTDDNGQVTQVKVKHILVKGKSLDEYLNEMKNKTKIWQLITI